MNIIGFKFESNTGKTLLAVNYDEKHEKTVKEIPDGYEIIGVKCKVNKFNVSRVGFVLWKPRRPCFTQ